MKKLRKRLFGSFLLSAFLLVSCATASDNVAMTNSHHDTYSIKGTLRSVDYEADYDFYYSGEFQYFTDYDNTIYHKDLAKLGIILSTSIDDMIQTSLTVGEKTKTGQKAVFDVLGMQDYQLNALKNKNYDVDQNDTTIFQIAHRSYPYCDGSKEVVFLVFAGTANEEEWLSDMDLGSTENYSSLTGEHPDYQDKAFHKGIDVAFHRALLIVETYLQDHDLLSEENSLFIAGHSRGGGLANMMGAYFERQKQLRTFTYTFASPRIIKETENDYKSVFNIVNEQDFVGALAPYSYGFERYGKDMFFNSADFQDTFKDETGFDYGSVDIDKLLGKFEATCPELSDLYTISQDKNNELFPTMKGRRYESREKAQEEIASLVSTYLVDYSPCFYRSEVVRKGDGYGIEIYDCPALALQTLGLIANSVLEVTDVAMEIIKAALIFAGNQLNLISYFITLGSGLGCNHHTFTYFTGLNHLKQ